MTLWCLSQKCHLALLGTGMIGTKMSPNPTFYPESLPASLKPIIKHRIEAMPTKLNESGLYSTSTLPSVKPIIE